MDREAILISIVVTSEISLDACTRGPGNVFRLSFHPTLNSRADGSSVTYVEHDRFMDPHNYYASAVDEIDNRIALRRQTM